MYLRRIVEPDIIEDMKKIWMNTLAALRSPSAHGQAGPEMDPQHVHHTPYDHRMSDRFRPSLSTR